MHLDPQKWGKNSKVSIISTSIMASLILGIGLGSIFVFIGVLLSITIIGAIIGIPMIITGIGIFIISPIIGVFGTIKKLKEREINTVNIIS